MILSQDHNWIQQVCWSTILPTEYYPMDKGTVKTDVAQVNKLPTAVTGYSRYAGVLSYQQNTILWTKGTVKTDVAQVSKLPTAVQVDPNDTGNDGSQVGNLPYLKRTKVN